MDSRDKWDDSLIKITGLPASPITMGMVVKNGQVRLAEPLRIPVDPEDENGEASTKATVRPIMENNEIVGLTHECACGKQTTILFSFGKK